MDKHILIISDSELGQLNGVSTTLAATIDQLEKNGFTVDTITPKNFIHFSWPWYKDVKISFPFVIGSKIKKINPDYIHISVEGPLGIAAKFVCWINGWNYTTAFHTDWAQYLQTSYKIPSSVTNQFLKWFHGRSANILVNSDSFIDKLTEMGLTQLAKWSRGVDRTVFQAVTKRTANIENPRWLYVGRVSKEKNIEEFLNLDLLGEKIVVGSGPELDSLKQKYPAVNFLGPLRGRDLAYQYSIADCFVFPSKTDTWGLVMAEAAACGTPIAALPVQGPLDVVKAGMGVLDSDLKTACLTALSLNRAVVAKVSQIYTWEFATKQFQDSLCKIKK